ncbi:unnamed protein product [Coregonus sp. 'balchen']|nr:unnamed protein product [Coregonus sp. 'balchen']
MNVHKLAGESAFWRETTVFVAMAHMNMAHMRDTKWLTLEVCREFQRGTCSRSDQECKFAHPAKSCQVENGRVIACFDSLKVRRKEIRHRMKLWATAIYGAVI